MSIYYEFWLCIPKKKFKNNTAIHEHVNLQTIKIHDDEYVNGTAMHLCTSL